MIAAVILLCVCVAIAASVSEEDIYFEILGFIPPTVNITHNF